MRRDTYIVAGIAVVAIIIGVLLSFYGDSTLSNVSPLAIASNDGRPAVTVSFTKLAEGVHSDVATSTNYLITSASEFEKLWQMVDAKGKVPTVDFTQSYVAAVFAGTEPTTGYTIAVSKVEDTGARTVVVTLTKPGKNCVLAQSTTAPYQLIELPKTSLTFAHTDQDTTTECK